MNKSNFIEKLTDMLYPLPANERDDILADYHEHFQQGADEGRSEEEIASALGDPSEIASEILGDINITVTETPEGSAPINKEVYFSLDKVKSVSVSMITEGITISRWDGKNISVAYYSSASNPSFNPIINMYIEGTTLIVKAQKHLRLRGIHLPARRRLEIKLPQNYNGSMKAKSISGGTVLNDGQFSSMELSSTSGGIKVNNVTVNSTAKLNSTSGSVNASNLKAHYLEAKSVSGSTNIFGDIKGDIVVGSVSGSVHLATTTLPPIKASSVSGSVKITIPKDSAFKIDASSVSGGISCDFPVLVQHHKRNKLRGVVGDGTKEIKLSSVSGSIKIMKAE